MALLAGLAAAMAPPLAWADSTDPAVRQAAQADYERLFKDMLRRPADLDLIFRFAEAAIRAENYESAVSALERLLLFNPNLPRVQLELGVLYYRMGSFQLARSYLSRAADAPDVPPDVRKRVAGFLEEIDRRTAASKIEGEVTVGLRWQSNANTGVDRLIRTGIFPGQDVFTPGGSLQPRSDTNAFVQASVEHTYDLGTQSGDSLVTGAVFYGTRQFRETQLDLSFGEVRSGPRLTVLPDTLPGVQVRPYIMANMVGLADRKYFASWGGGVELRAPLTARLMAETTAELASRSYWDSFGATTGRERTGRVTNGEVRFLYSYDDNTALWLGGGALNERARTVYNTSTEWRVGGGVMRQHPAPFGVTAGPWQSSLMASAEWTGYDGADPSVDPDTTRSDRTWRAGISTKVPLVDAWTLTGMAQRVVRTSNIPNYSYSSWVTTLGVTYRF
jgi:hypothetical protein